MEKLIQSLYNTSKENNLGHTYVDIAKKVGKIADEVKATTSKKEFSYEFRMRMFKLINEFSGMFNKN